MEYINIIKKLHETFPEFDVETIIKILEVIKSEEASPWVISNKVPNNKVSNDIIWARDMTTTGIK